jgi:DNA-binding NarL/FixJ family response regulator
MTTAQQPAPQPAGQGQEPFDLLTPRERQVAVLVALALTDSQIADSLFITLSTVKAHVGSVKSKLNLKSRTALCRWMLVSHYERNIVLFDNVLLGQAG